MHADNKLVKTMLSLLLVLFSVSSTISMEPKKIELLTTYASLKNNYKKTKDFLYNCNHKIATAGIITFSVGCGCGSGFLAFLLLKSYAAAALLGTLASPVAYGFQKLSKKIDELRQTIQDNHGEIKTLLVQGDEKVIGELKEHFTQQLELALEEIKKSYENSQDQTRKSLEHNIAHALEAMKIETDRQFSDLKTEFSAGISTLKSCVEEIKQENKIIYTNQEFFRKAIEEEKKLKEQAIKEERNTLLAEIKQIGSLYYACDAECVEEALQTAENLLLNEQSNKQLLYLHNKLRMNLLQKQSEGLLNLVLEHGQQITTLQNEVKETKQTLLTVVSRLDNIEQAQTSQGNQLNTLENFASNQTVHTAELRNGVSKILTIIDPQSKQTNNSAKPQTQTRVFTGLPNQFLSNPASHSELKNRALTYHSKN